MILRHTIEIHKSMRQMVSRDKTLSSSRISQFRISLSRFAPLKATKKTKNMEFGACAYHNFSRHNSVSFLACVVYDTFRESGSWSGRVYSSYVPMFHTKVHLKTSSLVREFCVTKRSVSTVRQPRDPVPGTLQVYLELWTVGSRAKLLIGVTVTWIEVVITQIRYSPSADLWACDLTSWKWV